MRTRTRYRLGVTSALVAVLVLALAVPAAAHVTVNPGEAPAGGYTKLTFRVPHGCDGSDTVSLRIQIPDGVVSVRPQVNPGWELETVEGPLAEPYESHGETITEGVTEVRWTGGPLPDAFMDEFGLSVKLPDGEAGDVLYFPAIQECEEGEAAWIEIPAEGEEEPPYPAPALTLTAGGEDDHGHSSGDEDADPAADLDDSEPVAATATTGPLAVVALVAGLLGAALGAGALMTVRRRT